MSYDHERTFSSDFKRFFLRGLVVLLPSVLTLWIVVMAYQFVDKNIAEPINRGIRLALNNASRYPGPLADQFNATELELNAEIARLAIDRNMVASRERVREELQRQFADPTRDELPQITEDQINAAIADRTNVQRAFNREAIRAEIRRTNIREWWDARWYMNLIGLMVAIVAVYTAGRLLGGYFGRKIYARLEKLLTTLPIFKQLYPSVKQVVDFLFSDEQPMKFNRVVVTEYPRKGIWSVGFLTGPTMKSIASKSGDAVTIFIPSSPTPFTGYTITVPREEVLEIPISVDEAIRFAVSGGVLIPDHQSLEELKSDPVRVLEGQRKTADASAGVKVPSSDELGGSDGEVRENSEKDQDRKAD
ncbi:MAG: DUF502 domain-containing protein [Phycisphaerales bacterium]|nr:MAG: DUF502 domain-containing protein [Phycisphaerales bacterium]